MKCPAFRFGWLPAAFCCLAPCSALLHSSHSSAGRRLSHCDSAAPKNSCCNWQCDSNMGALDRVCGGFLSSILYLLCQCRFSVPLYVRYCDCYHSDCCCYDYSILLTIIIVILYWFPMFSMYSIGVFPPTLLAPPEMGNPFGRNRKGPDFRVVRMDATTSAK